MYKSKIRPFLVYLLAAILWPIKTLRKHKDFFLAIGIVLSVFFAKENSLVSFDSNFAVPSTFYIGIIGAVVATYGVKHVYQKISARVNHPNKQKHLKRMYFLPVLASSFGLLLFLLDGRLEIESKIILGSIKLATLMTYLDIFLAVYSIGSLIGLLHMIAREEFGL